MSTLSLPLSQPREVTRRRLSLRRVEVAPQARREATTASSAIESVKSAVAGLPARLEALMRQSPAQGDAAQAVPLDAIMRGANTLPILHNGEIYTLRVTRYGKLILTKYSRNIPGEMESRITCGLDNPIMNEQVSSKSLFRRWRKMSGYL